MKKKIIFAVAAVIFSGKVFSQEIKYDWKNMDENKRKELIGKMSPQERMSLLKQFRENMVVSELEVPQEDRNEFKNLYSEYLEKQKEIKNKFSAADNYEEMSEEEAVRQLNKSFEVGQELLDNRKLYAEKFRKIVKPQRVLQLFQTEGMMRDKMMEHRSTRSGFLPNDERKTQPQRLRRP